MCDPFDVPCVALEGLSAGLDNIAREAGRAAATMVSEALTFWINEASVNPDTPAIRQLQGYTTPVVAVMLVGSILVQGIRMTLSRKKDPALNVALGLLRFAVVNAIGLTTVGLALQAGDALAESLISRGIADYAERMSGLFGGEVLTDPFGVLLLAGIAWVLGFIQWVITILRQAGLLVLAVLMLVAASGAINDSTKDWSGKLWGWLIALIAYKPAAALIYTIGFTLMGSGQDFTTVATGIAVLALAIVALPVMLKFFSWSGTAISGSASIGGIAAAGALGAVSLSSLRGGGGGGREGSGPGSSTAGRQASPGAGDSPGAAGGGDPTGGRSAGAAAGGVGAGGAGAGAVAAGVAPGVAAAVQLAQGAQQVSREAGETMATPPPDQPRRGPDGAAR